MKNLNKNKLNTEKYHINLILPEPQSIKWI